jgi:hypothetical protein
MTFLALVQAWKEHGRADKLAGASIDRRVPRPRRSLPEATRNAVRDAITSLGTTARHVDVVNEAHRRCDEISTKRASAAMVQYLLMKARRGAASPDGAPAVLIGHVVCKLPMRDGEKIVFPDLLLAVVSPEGTIAAHALATQGDMAIPLGRVLAGLGEKRTRMGRSCEVVIPVPLRELVTSARHFAFVTGPTTGRISHLLGAGIERVDIAHRRKASTGPKNGDSPMNTPLAPEDAAAAVQLAIHLHNESRGGLASFNVADNLADASRLAA